MKRQPQLPHPLVRHHTRGEEALSTRDSSRGEQDQRERKGPCFRELASGSHTAGSPWGLSEAHAPSRCRNGSAPCSQDIAGPESSHRELAAESDKLVPLSVRGGEVRKDRQGGEHGPRRNRGRQQHLSKTSSAGSGTQTTLISL